MKKVQYRKNRKGFTLAELLITVAITVILASFGFVSVSGYQRRLKLTEMDNTAREIFIAAQNHLTSSEASGSWNSVFQTDAAESDFGVKVSASTLGISDSSDAYRAILSTRGKEPSDGDYATAWNEILPYGSITESVRTEGQYIVIYNASSASIYGVLYTDNSSNAFGSVNSEFSFDLSKLSEYLELVQKTQDERVSYESGNGHVYIGWYGGALSKADNSSSADAPSLYFDNAEILKLNFNYSGSNYSYAVLKFTGNTSGAEVSVKVKTDGISPASDSDNSKIASGLNSSLSWKSVIGGSSFSISLDDITRQGGNFGYIFDTDTSDTTVVSSNGNASSAKFISGEDITVTAYAVRRDGTQSLTAVATANSLFEEVKGDLISISNGRHLQNLDASVSGILKSKLSSKSAKLTRNITWNTETTGFFRQVFALGNSTSVPTRIYGRDGKPKASSSSFCSIYNDLLSEVDGNNHTLAYFSFAGNDKAKNNAGLFAQNPQNPNTGTAFSIHNLTISDSSSSSSSGNAGILMGQSTYGLTISDVHITATGNNSVTVSAPKGSAGGLIGYLASAASSTTTESSNFTISDCYFVSSTTQNTDDSADQGGWVNGNTAAGGFIGTVQETNEKITVTISDSYSNTYVSLRSDSTNGASAGGFIGAISTTDGSVMIQRSYAAGRTVSKVYPDKADGRGRYNVYSPADGTYAGGFIGSANGRLTINACFSAASVYSSGDSSYSGGFIGAANGSSYVTIKGSYAAGKVFGTNHRGAFLGISSPGEMNASDCYALKGSGFNDSLSLISDNSAVSGIAFAESGAEGSPFAVDESSRKAATSNDAELLGEFYPFMTTSQLSSAYLNDSSQSENDKDNQYFGDWEVPGGTKILIVGVNGNKLTVHFAVPKGTEKFTIGVKGEDSGKTFYCPAQIDADGTIHWVNFLTYHYNTNVWTSGGTVSDFSGNSKTNVKENSDYSQLYSESKKDFQNAIDAEKKSGSKYGTIGSPSADDNSEFFALVLDDLTVYGHQFSDMFFNTGMLPGENITVSVVSGWNNSFKIDKSTGVYVNSLFDDGTKQSNHTALIANSRHLENLDEKIAGIKAMNAESYFAGFTIAKQTDNIHWNTDNGAISTSQKGTIAFAEELKNPSSGNVSVYSKYYFHELPLASDSSFVPIQNQSLQEYDGNHFSVENLTIDMHHVHNWYQTSGIFSELGAQNHQVSVHDLSLNNITSISVGAEAGGLAGKVTNGSFSNVSLTGNSSVSSLNFGSAGGLIGAASGSLNMSTCSAYGSDIAISVNGWGKSGGGLIGEIAANQKAVTISDSQAAVLIHAVENGAGGSNAGGLIGSISNAGSGSSVTASQSGGHAQNGNYSTTVFNMNLPYQQSNAGGLIGTISGSQLDIRNCYSTMSVYASQYAGGFIGQISDGTVQVNNCYSTGLVGGGSARGSFAGSIGNNSLTGTDNYYLNEINDSGVQPIGNGSFQSFSIEGKDEGTFPFRKTEEISTSNYDLTLFGAYPFQAYTTINGKKSHVGDWPESKGILVDNDNVLQVKFRIPNIADTWKYTIQIGIYGETSGSTEKKAAFYLFRSDKSGNVDWNKPERFNAKMIPITYDSETGILTLTLDDITSDRGNNRFAKLFPDFIPGENIDIYADYSSDPEFMNKVANQTDLSSFYHVKTNSLFGDGSFSSNYSSSGYSSQASTVADHYGLNGKDYSSTALILNTRHLENLSYAVSLYTRSGSSSISAQSAKQICDIDVSEFFSEVKEKHVYFDNTISDDSTSTVTKRTDDYRLIGIINDDLQSYDGGGHQIRNLSIGNTLYYTMGNQIISQLDSEIGMFACLHQNASSRDFSISNLTLVNPDLSGSISTDAGALIGKVYSGNNVTISKVSVISEEAASSKINGAHAGGLIGVSEGSSITINDSSVAGRDLSIAGQIDAGGLIGSASGSDPLTFRISNSSATAYVQQSADSVSGSAYYAGGLIGSLSWTGKAASITNTYAGGHTSEGNYLDTTDTSRAGRVNVYSANGT
ncbi:MAG: prepilin-type N-terminal cleavage/methylation domain-containing protein, partial [Lachnospiraceae bacterium]|nr:prepilin-type N-terminal cleavage/methylation domain-containing protein [Lachnospiraceae bacterium]